MDVARIPTHEKFVNINHIRRLGLTQVGSIVWNPGDIFNVTEINIVIVVTIRLFQALYFTLIF